MCLVYDLLVRLFCSCLMNVDSGMEFRLMLLWVCMVIWFLFCFLLLIIIWYGIFCMECLWILYLIFLFCKLMIVLNFCFCRDCVMDWVYLVCELVILRIVICMGESYVGSVLVYCLIKILIKCFRLLMMVWCSMMGWWCVLFLFMNLVFRCFGKFGLIWIVLYCYWWLSVFLSIYLIFGL